MNRMMVILCSLYLLTDAKVLCIFDKPKFFQQKELFFQRMEQSLRIFLSFRSLFGHKDNSLEGYGKIFGRFFGFLRRFL